MDLMRRRRADVDEDVAYGPSLAKGPALITGTILVAFGLTGLLTNADFPSASTSFPDGTVNGESWLGIEVNGWTNFFAITGGALLLFGAAQHHLAKTMSLLVGLCFAACAVIALIDGDDVLGLAAANAWTKLGFAVAAAVLLVNALMPRVKRTTADTTTTAGDVPGEADDRHRERMGRFRRRAPREERETVVAAPPPPSSSSESGSRPEPR